MSLQQGTLKAKNPSGIYREEEIVIDYPNTLAFLQNMKRIGANTPQKDYRPLSRHDLLKACAKTDEKFQGRITWNIIYGRLEAH